MHSCAILYCRCNRQLTAKMRQCLTNVPVGSESLCSTGSQGPCANPHAGVSG
ncbi:UNVERIFIED_CONTAM: hypothetical protein FKN15_077426 [Acipenser sinensis]